MLKIYTAANPIDAHVLRTRLEAEGITAEVRGEELWSIRGGVPMTSDTLPEVWIAEDADVDDARRVVADYERLRQEAGTATRSTPQDADSLAPVSSHVGRGWRVLSYLAVLAIGLVAGLSIPEAWRHWGYESISQDLNGDGMVDETWHYNDGETVRVEKDCNFDGRNDYFLYYEGDGEDRSEIDTNYDGIVDYWTEGRHYVIRQSRQDTNFDGTPDIWAEYEHGIIKVSRSYRDPERKRPAIMERYVDGVLREELEDTDGDGRFDRSRMFNHLGEQVGGEAVK